MLFVYFILCLNEVQIVCIMVQLMQQHPQTPLFLARYKFRRVLPVWYRLTQVVLKKRPLNGCVVVVVVVVLWTEFHAFTSLFIVWMLLQVWSAARR